MSKKFFIDIETTGGYVIHYENEIFFLNLNDSGTWVLFNAKKKLASFHTKEPNLNKALKLISIEIDDNQK